MSGLIEALSDETELELEAAFLDAIETIRVSLDVSALIEAAERGDEEQVAAYVGTHMKPLRVILDAAFARAGVIAADRLGLSFDPADTTTISARVAAFTDLMRSTVTDTARAMIQAAFRTTLLPAAVAGAVLLASPAVQASDKAILVREAIGLSPAQGVSLTVFRTALESAMAHQKQSERPMGFRRELPPIPELPPHVLRHLSASQRRVIEKGNTLALDAEKISILVADQRQTLLTIRARAIATSGALTATNAGEHASWRQAVDRRDLGPEWRRFWQDVGDEKVRHSHRQVKALNANGVGIDEPFDTPLGACLRPPLEINCRCRVELRRAL